MIIIPENRPLPISRFYKQARTLEKSLFSKVKQRLQFLNSNHFSSFHRFLPRFT